MNSLPGFSFQWHITDACDQRCRHCYIYAQNPDRVPDSMSAAEMQKTLEQCLAFCRRFGRAPYFYITGGDPVLHPDFWFLLELLHEKQIPFSILGNPFHLNEEVCQRMQALGCRSYQLSLDGLEKTHDRMRRPGSFQETLEKIPVIRSSGMKCAVMMTVSRTNMEEVLPVYRLCCEKNVDLFAFARYCPTSAEKSVGILPEEYRDFLIRVEKEVLQARASGAFTRFAKKDHLWVLHDYESGTFSIPEEAEKGIIYGGCHCGSSHLTIVPDGGVYACRRVQDSRVGNVLEEDLADLWLGPMEKYRDFQHFRKCSRCELLGFCRGCPAVAAGSTDFYDPDPQCWKEV